MNVKSAVVTNVLSAPFASDVSEHAASIFRVTKLRTSRHLECRCQTKCCMIVFDFGFYVISRNVTIWDANKKVKLTLESVK